MLIIPTVTLLLLSATALAAEKITPDNFCSDERSWNSESVSKFILAEKPDFAPEVARDKCQYTEEANRISKVPGRPAHAPCYSLLLSIDKHVREARDYVNGACAALKEAKAKAANCAEGQSACLKGVKDLYRKSGKSLKNAANSLTKANREIGELADTGRATVQVHIEALRYARKINFCEKNPKNSDCKNSLKLDDKLPTRDVTVREFIERYEGVYSMTDDELTKHELKIKEGVIRFDPRTPRQTYGPAPGEIMESLVTAEKYGAAVKTEVPVLNNTASSLEAMSVQAGTTDFTAPHDKASAPEQAPVAHAPTPVSQPLAATETPSHAAQASTGAAAGPGFSATTGSNSQQTNAGGASRMIDGVSPLVMRAPASGTAAARSASLARNEFGFTQPEPFVSPAGSKSDSVPFAPAANPESPRGNVQAASPSAEKSKAAQSLPSVEVTAEAAPSYSHAAASPPTETLQQMPGSAVEAQAAKVSASVPALFAGAERLGKNGLSEKLRRALLEGDAGTAKGAATVTTGDAVRAALRGTTAFTGELPAGNGALFGMSPSDTEQELRRLEEERSGTLGEESENLFVRVHETHERVLKRGGLKTDWQKEAAN